MTPLIFSRIEELRAWLDHQGYRRALLVCGPSRRFVTDLQDVLGLPELQVFDGALPHVPEQAVAAALAAARSVGPDVLITVGGGSATGLGKALKLQYAPTLPFVAIPTTYAGSELTSIHGVLRDGVKQVGRDERALPDAVVRDPRFTQPMPRRLTVTSLMNALAHPLGALPALDAAGVETALEAVQPLVDALQTLVQRPTHGAARQTALLGAARAAQVLEAGTLGPHHRAAHHLGGALGAEHAAVHAVLLCHTAATLPPALQRQVAAVTRVHDLPGLLFDCLQRAGAPVSLVALSDRSRVEAALVTLPPELPEAMRRAVSDAALGRNPSLRFHRQADGAALLPASTTATRAVVALHGRGASAEAILAEARALVGDAPHVLLLAPQAPHGAWYPGSYAAPLASQATEVAAALAAVDHAVETAAAQVGRRNVTLLGFSQGACLAVEWLLRTPAPVGGLVALSGAALGPAAEHRPAAADLSGVRVVLGIARGDAWVSAEDVAATASRLSAAGASVDRLEASPGPHRIRGLERLQARAVLTGHTAGVQVGYGSAHATEALAGALPVDQNSPRHAPYGLYPEQVNGTGFAAPRHHNLRSWLYRIRPSAQHTSLTPLPHPTLTARFDGPAEPNLAGWRPLPFPEAPTDFVDGLITVGGAGAPALRRGFALHLYAANTSMDARAFSNADGDLLIIPQEGRLVLQTELGVLDVAPGQVAVVPRGIRFSALLPDGVARGYVGETFGRHFELPDRGPVGANGLADARHFEAPTAWHEDRLVAGYRLAVRFGGELFEATQDHSPYDVVAWHGNYAPYRYDLKRFCPAGFTRFDHTDPSVFTVLSSPLDEPGSHGLDFVFFPPRWDATEHTFRPPFFHRNATTEINGIISDPGLSPDGSFAPGCTFLTPALTPHGVVERVVERVFAARSERADAPTRIGDQSAWFQFESALPLQLTAWARSGPTRIADWSDHFGVYRTHFTPDAPQGPWGEE